VECVEDMPAYFAKCFKEALEGKAHTEQDITRILIRRSGVILNLFINLLEVQK